MIQFSTIFNRAVNLFDDPDIRRKYYSDPVGFQKVMRPFLINGKNRFTEPTVIVDQLSNYSEPQGQMESFVGDNTDTYILETDPVEGACFSYRVNGEFVQAHYDAENKTVQFNQILTEEDNIDIIWFHAGCFTSDITKGLSKVYPSGNIEEKIINILAHGLLSAWTDEEMNRALEVRNILSDADMSFYSPANSTRSKIEWHKQINRDMDTLIAELNWRIFATSRGSRFGK